MNRREVRFRRVAIFCHNKPEKERAEAAFLRELLRFLHARGCAVAGDGQAVSLLRNSIEGIDVETRYDLKIGIGGDGTLLKMVRNLQKKDGLIVGVNFGTLGFLSELRPENAMDGIAKIFDGNFHTDRRMLLKAFVWRKNDRGEREKIFRAYGLNEIVFGHGGLARLTSFHVKVDRRNLSTYRSDGLIFATPTGSTAYSLSAGGPIISPEIHSILVTPIAPHTLTHRPIVLTGDRVIHLDFDGRAESIAMTIDGQIHFSLKPTDEISLQKATRMAEFVRLRESHFFRTLRGKMGWGG